MELSARNARPSVAPRVDALPEASGAKAPDPDPHDREPRPAPRLVDATMFWNPSGGVRRYVVAKRDWLHRHSAWQHTVATPTPDAPGMLPIGSLPLPGSGGAYRLPWRRGAAARQLVAARPDLIESADPYRLAWSTLDAARSLAIPAVAFCHSNLPRMAALALQRPFGGMFERRAERAARDYLVRLYRRFDLVLAPSQSMTAQLLDWGVTSARHQPLGVDCTVFDPGRRLGTGWRASLGIPGDAQLLVFAGRFAPEKDLPTLAAAVRLLGSRYWLLAVGAGPRPPGGERVVMLPPIAAPERLAAVLASADVFVHAGAQETFGLSVLEALACGLPVVARAAAGTGELVDDTVGAAVGAGTPQAFAEAIAGVLERDQATLHDAARRRGLANDWKQVLPGLLRHYDRLTGRSVPAQPRPA